MANLVVEGGVLFLRVDVNVIAQTVEQLRSVGLRVDGFEQCMFNILAALGAPRLGAHVYALGGAPLPSETSQRPEVRQRVWIDVGGFGENVLREIMHRRVLGQISRPQHTR